MKTTKQISAGIMYALFISALFITGCKKESTASLTADDATDAVSYATASSTGGLSAQTADAALYANTQGYYKTNGTAGLQSLACGVPFDTSVTLSYTGVTSATYTGDWNYLLSCNGNTPESVSLTGSYTGNFDAPRMSSSNSGARNWTISGLDNSTSTPYTFNGTFTRTGSHTSKVRNQYTFTTNMTITVTSLTVSKTTYLITGGSGSVTVTGTVSNGNSYNFSGNIVFNGNNTATLTINGNNYTINL